jgi:hypothetical protein
LWRPLRRSNVGDGSHVKKMPQICAASLLHDTIIPCNLPHPSDTNCQLPTLSPTPAQSLINCNLPASLVAGTPSVGGIPRFPDRPLTCAPTSGTRFRRPVLAFCPYRHFHKQKLAPLHPSTAHRTPHRPPKPIGPFDTIDSYHRSPSPHCARKDDKSNT